MILEILEYLKKEPQVLTGNLSDHLVEIIISNKKKRYTEFYRICVTGKTCFGEAKEYFWVRVLKNKPDNIMLDSINKQYTIIKRLEVYLDRIHYGRLQLSCCKPVLLLPEFKALITKECKGVLFNSYLKKQIPFLRHNQILEHCFNIGVWLKQFHECYKVLEISSSEKDVIAKRFKGIYGIYPISGMDYITCCHNDYSPRNIFVGKDFVEVIDYVGVEKGFPEEDINFFTNYVINARFNLLYPKRLKRNMIGAFRDGYDMLKEIE